MIILKKIITALLFFSLIFVLLSCAQTQETEVTTYSISVPQVEYSNYEINYIAIRNMDSDGRTLSIDYFYDNFTNVSSNVESILNGLYDATPNGGIGPLYGRYNNAWIKLEAPDSSTLTLNLYKTESSTILGLIIDDNIDNITEYFFVDYFGNNITSILNYYL